VFLNRILGTCRNQRRKTLFCRGFIKRNESQTGYYESGAFEREKDSFDDAVQSESLKFEKTETQAALKVPTVNLVPAQQRKGLFSFLKFSFFRKKRQEDIATDITPQ